MLKNVITTDAGFGIQVGSPVVMVGGQVLDLLHFHILVLALRRHFVELSASTARSELMANQYQGRSKIANLIERRRLFGLIERLDGVYPDTGFTDHGTSTVNIDGVGLGRAELEQIYDALTWYRDNWTEANTPNHKAAKAIIEMFD